MNPTPRRSILTGLLTALVLFAAAAVDATSISAPNVVFASGSTGTLSIAYTNASTDYTGIDLVIRYDSDVANPGGAADLVTIVAKGHPSDGWDIATNIVEDVDTGNIDELRISAASFNPLALAPGGTTLLDIAFTAATAAVPTSTTITFELAELNETAVTATSGSIAIGGVDADVSLTPSTLLPGASVTVTVVDAGMAGTGSATARVINSTTGDTEPVSLVETPFGSGSFTVDIATEFNNTGAVVNGKIGVKKDDVLTAEFDDVLAADGTATTFGPAPGGDITVLGGVTGALSVSMSSPYPGTQIDVLLTDLDLKNTGSVVVTVTNSTSGDDELLTLLETPSNSGIFIASIATVYDDGSSPMNQGTVGVKKDDVVTATYADQLNDIGGPELVSPTPGSDISILGGDTGDLSLSPSSLAPGTPLTIQVIDLDLLGAGSIVVTVTNSTTGDTESVTLTETPPNSGTFIESIDTEFHGGGSGTGNSGNGLLGIKSGDIVTASYSDARNDDGGPETVGPAGGDLTISGGTNGTVAIAPVSIIPGGLVTVTVLDADLSGSVDVIVRSRNSGGTEKETVTATLAQTAPGTFSGTVSTVFGVAVSAGGRLDVQKDDEIEAEYADALTSTGGTATLVSPTTTLILGGVLGTLTTSAGIQAGDGLRIELADADLNVSITVKETATVTINNVTGGDVEVVTLTETGLNTGKFRIVPPVPTSSAGTSGDNVLQVSPQDDITITYVDVLDAIGGVTNDVASTTGTRWGDTSKNGSIRSLDAALILQENVFLVTFDDYQSLVADVIPQSGAGVAPNPNALDASEILKYSVGLISTFPVQTGIPNPHPYKRLNVTRRLAVGEPQVVDGVVRLSILADDVEGLLAGNLTLSFDTEQMKVRDVLPSERTGGFAVFSNVDNGRLHIAFAGADIRGAGEGALLDIEVEALQTGAVASLRFEEASLNGGETPAVIANDATSLSLPQSFALLQNWPNPFNPETQIRYQVAEEGPVTLRVYDMTGQTIVGLVSEHQSAGTYTVRWNGLDDAGHAVATGVYFYRLEAGGNVLTRKMSLLR